MATITGYKKDTEGSWIDKDPSAQLVYNMEWNQWLATGQSLASTSYAVSTVSGDASPLTNEGSGISGTQTYIELSGGTAGEIYTVTATITTDDGATDRRAFKVKVDNRYV